MNKFFAFVTAFVVPFLVQTAASATTITGSIAYYVQPESGSHDFGNAIFCNPCGLHYSNEVTGTLGVNGLPVLNPGYSGPAITQLTTGNQLNWWSSLTSTGTFSTNSSGLYDQHLFTPNGTGSNNSSSFQTAILTTTNLLANTAYSITYTGDDDVFLALNGQVISQDGGVHAIGQLTTASFNTGAADNQLEIFFADRYNVDSELKFTISAVPEPSTWAMMILGFLGVGFMAYRGKNNMAFRFI
jgi:hypothetical protein